MHKDSLSLSGVIYWVIFVNSF